MFSGGQLGDQKGDATRRIDVKQTLPGNHGRSPERKSKAAGRRHVGANRKGNRIVLNKGLGFLRSTFLQVTGGCRGT